MRTRPAATIGVLAAVLLAASGCSGSATSADSTSSAGSTDCGLARAAMDGYSVALAELATSLEVADAMSAVAAADAMSYALDQLEVALPGIPAAGQGFLAASRVVLRQVKQSAADSPAMPGLAGELAEAFSDPAFAEGGEAIDAYADQVCPEASGSAAP